MLAEIQAPLRIIKITESFRCDKMDIHILVCVNEVYRKICGSSISLYNIIRGYNCITGQIRAEKTKKQSFIKSGFSAYALDMNILTHTYDAYI